MQWFQDPKVPKYSDVQIPSNVVDEHNLYISYVLLSSDHLKCLMNSKFCVTIVCNVYKKVRHTGCTCLVQMQFSKYF